MKLYLIIEGEYDEKDPHSIHSDLRNAIYIATSECARDRNLYTIYELELDKPDTPYKTIGRAYYNHNAHWAAFEHEALRTKE